MLFALEHVAKTHWVGPYEKRTLVDVSLTLAPGDFVGVWGARRAGKSTLLRIAAGLDQPDGGRVLFDGRDLAALSDARRAELRLREIGLLLGSGPHSPEFTVCDYVSLPLLVSQTRASARGVAIAMLRKVGIADCRDARWHQLSDSERALANAAHALVRQPRLLLADDPAPDLDPLQQGEVMRLLRGAAADDGVAVLMTAAAMSALAAARTAFVLGDGELTEVREPREEGGREAQVIDFPGGRQQA
jgi:putative ABC transport system ATP-binding protein